jgi:molybdopterin-guanine dinucleotide biosynthesis adapter protein
VRAIGIAGWSGAGKTTLITRLIPELNRRGLSVSTIKCAHHGFDVDRPGKDSYEHRAAGANGRTSISSRVAATTFGWPWPS